MTTPTDLAAFLIVEGCLPMIAGTPPRVAAPAGTPLSAGERKAAGFEGPGVTMRYATGAGDVIADFGATTATVRLPEGEIAPALNVIDKAVLNAPGDTQSAEEANGPAGAKLRTYFVRVNAERYARVALVIPAAAHGVLEARVTGLAAVGYASGGVAPAA